MKDSTRKLLGLIDSKHDWKHGQSTCGTGSEIRCTDICRVCGLRRHMSAYGLSTDTEYRFSDGETDSDLSIRQAFHRLCE
jgi:hypothetical protein